MTRRILAIGDTHSDPSEDQSRYHLLSNLIVDEQPDEIVFMGDFLDFLSISSHEQPGSLMKEGTKLRMEIDHAKEMLKLVLSKIDILNKKLKRGRRKLYTPKIVFLEGNHEFRLRKHLAANSILEDLVKLENELADAVPTMEFKPYGTYYEVDNVMFTHIPFGLDGRPISGRHVSTKAINVVNKSCVYGHTHRLEVQNYIRHGDSEPLYCISVGCFFQRDPAYLMGGLIPYWRGVVLLETNSNGIVDVETRSLEKMTATYSLNI